jgi:hypothetical protein
MGGETKGNETKAIKWQWFSPLYMGPRYENKIKEKITSLMAVVEGCPDYWCSDNSCHGYCGQCKF